MIKMLCGLSKKWKVNYSTTYKIIRFAILFLMVNSLFVCSVSADEAIERIAPLIPLGDVLVVYSDGASAEDVEAVSDIVEILTYQAFQVSYGTATQAVKAAAEACTGTDQVRRQRGQTLFYRQSVNQELCRSTKQNLQPVWIYGFKC